jgi:two-component system copper resistance phosphate regulon response regulator CusR
MSILVVEDEKRVLDFLTEALRKEGYIVHPCETYDGAVEMISGLSTELDVIVMDRLLHRTDAITLISTARQNCPNVRILILSTINSPAQKAAALDLGADDYMAKPFSLVELSARVRSLSRRHEGRSQTESYIFSVRDLQINALEHKATVSSKPIDLSNKEYLLLLTLLQHPGRVFNKFQLLDKVWDTQFDIESNVVEVTVKNLRKKLLQAGSQTEILSRRNIGYWIEA